MKKCIAPKISPLILIFGKDLLPCQPSAFWGCGCSKTTHLTPLGRPQYLCWSNQWWEEKQARGFPSPCTIIHYSEPYTQQQNPSFSGAPCERAVSPSSLPAWRTLLSPGGEQGVSWAWLSWVYPFPSLEGTFGFQFCCLKTTCAISDTLCSPADFSGAEGKAGDPQSSGEVAGEQRRFPVVCKTAPEVHGQGTGSDASLCFYFQTLKHTSPHYRYLQVEWMSQFLLLSLESHLVGPAELWIHQTSHFREVL